MAPKKRRYYPLTVLILWLLSTPPGVSQDGGALPDSTFPAYRKPVSVVAVSSLFAVTLVDAYFQFWKGNYRSFGFYDPAVKGGWFGEAGILGIDKTGHLYGSYFLYRTKKNLLLWGGFEEATATWIAAALTGGVEFLIEVGDGFSDYAFDYRDLLIDAAGIGYGILQDNVPFFRNFMIKWSYYPPDFFSLTFTKHYDGHIFWLCADVHNLLGEEAGRWWPSFLMPAIGFSVGDKGAHREFVLGIDLNLSSLFDRQNPHWDLLRKELELYHLPAPGVKFAPGYPPAYKLLLLH